MLLCYWALLSLSQAPLWNSQSPRTLALRGPWGLTVLGAGLFTTENGAITGES